MRIKCALDSFFARRYSIDAKDLMELEGISINLCKLWKRDLEFSFSATYQAKCDCSDDIKISKTFFSEIILNSFFAITPFVVV